MPESQGLNHRGTVSSEAASEQEELCQPSGGALGRATSGQRRGLHLPRHTARAVGLRQRRDPRQGAHALRTHTQRWTHRPTLKGANAYPSLSTAGGALLTKAHPSGAP